MSLFRTTVLFKLFYPILFLSLLTLSCSTDNSITGGSDQTNLSKPSDIEDYFSGDDDEGYIFESGLVIPFIFNDCVLLVELFAPYILESAGITPYNPNNNNTTKIIDNRDELIAKSYDFRDNYLSNSDKGQKYTEYYTDLSKYSISNNIIGEYYMEHILITPILINIARDMQYGTNQNQILINKSTYDDLKNIVKIYRDSENHTDIDVVLDYLETDLEKYYNKTKVEIAVDFGF